MNMPCSIAYIMAAKDARVELARARLGEAILGGARAQAGGGGWAQGDLGGGIHRSHQPALAGARSPGRPQLRLQLRRYDGVLGFQGFTLSILKRDCVALWRGHLALLQCSALGRIFTAPLTCAGLQGCRHFLHKNLIAPCA